MLAPVNCDCWRKQNLYGSFSRSQCLSLMQLISRGDQHHELLLFLSPKAPIWPRGTLLKPFWGELLVPQTFCLMQSSQLVSAHHRATLI